MSDTSAGHHVASTLRFPAPMQKPLVLLLLRRPTPRQRTGNQIGVVAAEKGVLLRWLPKNVWARWDDGVVMRGAVRREGAQVCVSDAS